MDRVSILIEFLKSQRTKGLASQKERTETDERMFYLLTHGENLVSEKNTAAFMEWYHLNKN